MLANAPGPLPMSAPGPSSNFPFSPPFQLTGAMSLLVDLFIYVQWVSIALQPREWLFPPCFEHDQSSAIVCA
ncbi:hypothetical protein DPMN_104496 [Dreissena polymorpha]|uniref:Uncharacterized protein n=1 Tax=Dreissena polymorpha TaxID=45954 RepID=A0A9D4H7W6_DREPO|nr:hypothetical protein DPMN_104496 [Dreissena polymorpha]